MYTLRYKKQGNPWNDDGDDGDWFEYEIDVGEMKKALSMILCEKEEIFGGAEIPLKDRMVISSNFVETLYDMDMLDELADRYYEELRWAFEDKAFAQEE